MGRGPGFSSLTAKLSPHSLCGCRDSLRGSGNCIIQGGVGGGLHLLDTFCAASFRRICLFFFAPYLFSSHFFSNFFRFLSFPLFSLHTPICRGTTRILNAVSSFARRATRTTGRKRRERPGGLLVGGSWQHWTEAHLGRDTRPDVHAIFPHE